MGKITLKKRCTRSFFIIVLIFFSKPDLSTAQYSIGINSGAGIFEFLHIGARFQLKNSQLGINYGVIPTKSDESLYAIGADYYYHYGKLTKYSDFPRGYFRTSMNYTHDENTHTIHKNLFMQFRVGRDIYFSDKLGLSIDGGIGIKLVHDKIRKEPSHSGGSFNLDIDVDTPILPALSVTLFLRI